MTLKGFVNQMGHGQDQNQAAQVCKTSNHVYLEFMSHVSILLHFFCILLMLLRSALSFVVIFCGYPGLISNGNLIGNIFNYSSTVSYTCVTGYKLSGDFERTCQSNGSWSGAVPVCTSMSAFFNYTLGLFGFIISIECVR